MKVGILFLCVWYVPRHVSKRKRKAICQIERLKQVCRCSGLRFRKIVLMIRTCFELEFEIEKCVRMPACTCAAYNSSWQPQPPSQEMGAQCRLVPLLRLSWVRGTSAHATALSALSAWSFFKTGCEKSTACPCCARVKSQSLARACHCVV